MNKAGVLNAVQQFRFPEITPGETVIFVDVDFSIWRVIAPDGGLLKEWQCEPITQIYAMELIGDIKGGLYKRTLLPAGNVKTDLPGNSTEVIGWAQRWSTESIKSNYLVTVMR